MAETGTADLILAVREVQIENALLAKVGVFSFGAPRDDEPPYFVNGIHETGRGNKRLTGRDSLRTITLSMKAVAEEIEGREAIEIASELANENYKLFGPPEKDVNDLDIPAPDGLTARQRLNRKLEPLGWTSKMPIEVGEIGPYVERLDDLERLHYGHRFRFTIERMRA
ncbi:MAG: hypothetical protein KY445_02720 [Armatimonadetes bacterium]|nr:hypothetical protein [Armatimonadota bacterium]